FNKQTLRYEKVVEPLSTTVLRIFGFLCAAAVTAFIFTVLSHKYLPSPKEKDLAAKVERLERFIESESEQRLDQLQSVVDNLQERDAYVHRMIFGIEPIDENIWNGGVGGHDKYGEFDIYGSAGELMSSLQQRIDRLKHQVTVQSRSLDTIINMAKDKEAYLAAMPTIKPVRSDLLARSLLTLSGFGPRLHPVFKVMKMHNGIDFTAATGTPIVATGNGRVKRTGRAGGYGKLVVIDHGYGYETYYAHMSKIDVRVGQKVERGEQIGRVGNTGTSTGPHCHYEVRKNGKPLDPINFVMDGLSPEEYHALTEAAKRVNQSLH
ncbi:MAG: peptidoglycan DD-metalloendopeptidase family protein, partial [Bacteroidota bacterium]